MKYGIVIDGERFLERYNLEQAYESCQRMRMLGKPHEYCVGESHRPGSWFMLDDESVEEMLDEDYA